VVFRADTALVERGSQLDDLSTVMRDPSGTITLIEGEAGAGKTALLAEARRALDDRAEVWHARCEPLAVPAPYAALYETRARMPVQLRDIVRSGDRSVGAFAAVLDQLRSQPTVFVIDDLQWIDTATAGLIRYVARRIDDAPSAIVGAYRADDLAANTDAADVVAEVGRQGRQIPLPPLTVAGVAELAALLAPARTVDAAAVHRLTGGNPLFVNEVLRHEGEEVPGSVASIVAAGLRRLPIGAQRVVEAIALCPEGLDVDLAMALSVDAGSHVDIACERRLLTCEGGRLQCRHDLIRAAVDGTIPPVRRRQLHREIAAALRVGLAGGDRTPREIALLAHHAAGGGLAHQAVDYSLAAATTAVAAKAHREAGRHLMRALQFRDAMTADELDTTIGRAVHELGLAGRFDEAELLADEMLRRATDDGARADALLQLGSLANQRNHCNQGADLIRASVALAPGRSISARIEAATQVASLAYGEGRLPEAAEVYEATIDDARASGDEGLAARMLARLASVRTAAGDADGVAMFEQAISCAVAADADDHAAYAHNNLGASLVWWFDVPAARHALRAGLDFTATRQLDPWHTSMRSTAAVAETYAGDWAAAQTHLGFDPAASTGTCDAAELLYVVAAIRTRRGLPDNGSVAHALRAADAEPESLYFTKVYAGELALEAAWVGVYRRDDALRRLETQLHTPALAHDPWARTRLGFWALRLTGRPGCSDVAGPLAHELAGRHDEAAAGWDARGCAYHAALTLAATPEPPVDEVVARLESLGAAGALAAVRRDWRNRGVKGRGRSAPMHPSGLSARQVDVLVLLASGRTNAEIANDLFISEKTAGHHVSAILTRFGVSSRRSAATLARERGWVSR
jgi:DNA-binding CsgD family transcriptional regulator